MGKVTRIDLRLLATLILAASGMFAQQKAVAAKTPSTKPGVVSGRVFLITGSGDLKPARLAKLYLIYSPRPIDGVTNQVADKSAGLAWAKARTKAATDSLEEYKRDGADWNDAVSCRHDMLHEDAAIVEILQWGRDQKKSNQIYPADADEEGNFKINNVSPAGGYFLVARGRAGFNDALWE